MPRRRADRRSAPCSRVPSRSRNERAEIAYRGTGSLEEAAEAIEKTGAELHQCCKRQQGEPGTLAIECTQRQPWWVVLAHNLPQRARWSLQASEDGQLTVRCALSAFRWCQALILALWLSILLALVLAFHATDPEQVRASRELGLLLSAVAIVALLATFLVIRLLGAYGGRLSTRLWQPVLLRIEAAGGSLEPVGSGVSRAYAGWVGAFVLSILLVAGKPVAEGLLQIARRGAGWLLAGFLALALALFLSAALIGLRRGFVVRVDTLLCGIGSALGVLLFFATPWLLLAAGDAAATSQRSGAAFLLLAAAVPPAMGLGLMLVGISAAQETHLPLWRLQQQRGTTYFDTALRRGPLLHLFRLVFLLVWGLAALLMLVVLALAVSSALQALWPALPVPRHPGPAAASIELVTLLLGREASGWIARGVRSVWVIYGLLAVVLLAISVGQLVGSRRRMRKELRRQASWTSPLKATAQAFLDRKAGRPGWARLAVTTKKDRMEATAFGGWRRERFIQLSNFFLQHLPADELEAVLLHELVHLRAGHPWRLNLLRWLGRLTFVGDGFTLAFHDSLGYESEADEVGEARRPALARALQKVAPTGRRANSGELSPAERQALALPPGWRARWALAWNRFRQQYFQAMALHYWHPTAEARQRALDRADDKGDAS